MKIKITLDHTTRTATLADNPARFEQLKADYEQTKELLPENVELSRALESLQITARNNNLIVTAFSPTDKDGKGDAQKDFYRMKQISVNLVGNYPNLKNFFRDIADLKRVVNITNLTITSLNEQREGQTLGANFILSALYAEKQDVNNLQPLPPPKAEKPPAGAPPAPPAAPARPRPPGRCKTSGARSKPVSRAPRHSL